jgi:hypothetical protein
MTSVIESVDTGLQNVIQTTLGSSYSRLTHEFHIEENTFTGSAKRWGLVPISAPNTDGNNRAVSLNYEFEIILTDEYVTTTFGEDAVRAKMVEMFGQFESLWKDLANKKGEVSQHARMLSGFSVDKVLWLEEQKIIAGYGSFAVMVQLPF